MTVDYFRTLIYPILSVLKYVDKIFYDILEQKKLAHITLKTSA